MHFSPSDSERSELNNLTPAHRYQYAVPRFCECEEVWGLGDSSGWLIRDVSDRGLISIWPYQSMAQECMVGEFQTSEAICVSLEHFLYSLLGQCDESEIDLEICPAPGKAGHKMTANELYEVLNGMVEAETYFVEG